MNKGPDHGEEGRGKSGERAAGGGGHPQLPRSDCVGTRPIPRPRRAGSHHDLVAQRPGTAGSQGFGGLPLPGKVSFGCRHAGLKSKASFQRTKRPREGEGKCAVHMMVELSQRLPNSSRRDRPACAES
jgi:hypothetical protein